MRAATLLVKTGPSGGAADPAAETHVGGAEWAHLPFPRRSSRMTLDSSEHTVAGVCL